MKNIFVIKILRIELPVTEDYEARESSKGMGVSASGYEISFEMKKYLELDNNNQYKTLWI